MKDSEIVIKVLKPDERPADAYPYADKYIAKYGIIAECWLSGTLTENPESIELIKQQLRNNIRAAIYAPILERRKELYQLMDYVIHSSDRSTRTTQTYVDDLLKPLRELLNEALK